MKKLDITLTDLIEKYKQKDIAFHFKLSILLDACKGLRFLHSKDIIHRDLSSSNIMLFVTKQFVRAKITDFGKAKQILFGNLTIVPGTPAFMPPEAFDPSPKYGKPLDVFSLACVCIHLDSLKFPTPDSEKRGKSEAEKGNIFCS